jgi:hypothetical protein
MTTGSGVAYALQQRDQYAERLVEEIKRTAALENENAQLRRLIGGLTKIGETPDGGVVIGPVGWGQLKVTAEIKRIGAAPDVRHVLMAVQSGGISTGRAQEIIRALVTGGDYTLPAPTEKELETHRRAMEVMEGEETPLEAIARLADLVKSLKLDVVAFCAPWAVEYADMHGMPKGHIHPAHYDVLAKAGARMDDFTRGDFKSVGA